MQKVLSNEQIEAFYHDEFVEDQVRDFKTLVDSGPSRNSIVVDVGGGCGFFAKRLSRLTSYNVRVIDMDTTSVEACRESGVEAFCGDALNPDISLGKGGVACFNLILHHLIGASEQITLDLQRKALGTWRSHMHCVFVNEYIYESYLGNLSGWLIFQITKNRILSWIGRTISYLIPSFKANTFGVGVRFRAHNEWKHIFESAGYVVTSMVTGNAERVAIPLRLLLIKTIRRDSFLLTPAVNR
jgi:hypothetical protein